MRFERKIYTDKNLLRRTLRIAYPPGLGQVVLRTDLDWNKDIEAISAAADGI